MITPWIILVSSMDPPCFFTIWMLSVSTYHLPLVFSATVTTASTATSAMCSREPTTDLDIIAVMAILRRVETSLMSMCSATVSSTSSAFSAAMR